MMLVSTPDMTVLALAVMTTAVRALHDTGCATSTLVVSMVVPGLSRGLVSLIKHDNHSDEYGRTEGQEALV